MPDLPKLDFVTTETIQEELSKMESNKKGSDILILDWSPSNIYNISYYHSPRKNNNRELISIHIDVSGKELETAYYNKRRKKDVEKSNNEPKKYYPNTNDEYAEDIIKALRRKEEVHEDAKRIVEYLRNTQLTSQVEDATSQALTQQGTTCVIF